MTLFSVVIIILTIVVTAFTVYNFVRSESYIHIPDCEPKRSPKEEPKIKEFKNYLIEKMRNAIITTLSDSSQLQDPKVTWSPGNQFGMAIYMKNTPMKTGPVKAWASFCGGWQSSEDECSYGQGGEILEGIEPKFYFGSGTKPITATITASKLYKLWKEKVANKSSKPEDFIDWYSGKPNSNGIRGGLDAVTYRDLFNITNGFSESKFVETVSRNSNTQSPDSSNLSYTQTLQDWIFCCPNGGLISSCSANSGLFCDNSCNKLCPVPLNEKVYGDTCKSPFCPEDLCTWAWTRPDGTPTPKDPNSFPWEAGSSCSCKKVLPAQYSSIINNLSIYNVAMMRSGVPDSDSIWAIDTAAQLASRTNPIGPIQFVAEIIGFDWNPLWTIAGPMTQSAILKTNSKKSVLVKARDGQPAAMYSSSAYTFLGCLLWLLTSTNGKQKDWSAIDLNSLLPMELYCLINFAGTAGNSGKKYLRRDDYNNQYYSYEATVDAGNVSHSPLTTGSPITDIQSTLETIESYQNIGKSQRSASNIDKLEQRELLSQSNVHYDEAGLDKVEYKKSPVYPRNIRVCGSSNIPVNNMTQCLPSPGSENPVPTVKKINFVDWDASSGVMCGNGWGACSGMAEIYMNIFSPTAEHPIMPKEVQKSYVENFLQYEGPNWKSLYNNKLRAPYCLGGQAWGQGFTYNCGSMGPDWFYMMNRNPGPWYQKNVWSDGKAGVIPCYGHLGDTYGYCSCHVYFPGGTLKAYPPLKSNNWAYVSPEKANEWSLVFEFAGGLEFTISCAQNSCISESQGPIQHFIYEVVKDPFKWD